MKRSMPVMILVAVAGVFLGPASALAQSPASRPAGAARFETERVTWRMRTTVGHRDLFRWRLGVDAGQFRQLTLSDAAERINALGLANVVGSNTQRVSSQVAKNLDYSLTPDELTAVKARLREFNLQLPVYQVDSVGADSAARRKLFEFAKALGVETIISSPEPTALAELDRLAEEFGVNVAIRNRGRSQTPGYWDPKSALSALEGRGKRIGVSADVGAWMRDGIKPTEALSQLKGRVLVVNLGGRSGAAGMTELFREMNRLEMKPMFLTLDSTGATDTFSDLSRSVEGFEKTVQPVMGELVNQISRTRAIRGPQELSAEVRQKIDAAIPRQAPAKPKKPRKLLVMDVCIANMSHNTIPHGNFALELMGKYTGAFEAVFDNNLDNLKWPQIRQYDAIFLNDTTGEIFADPGVRAGLLRFVREGGGLGGIHGVTYTSRNWPEFMDMIGAGTGPHWVHPATWKFDDPDSPLTKMFAGEPFTYTDEYYRFLANENYSREKVHVLFSVDMSKTDMTQARAGYFRPDNDYAIAWIRSYGKGRVYTCSLGHMTDLFMQPKINQHFLAAIQFILGDIEADTTPSAKLAARK